MPVTGFPLIVDGITAAPTAVVTHPVMLIDIPLSTKVYKTAQSEALHTSGPSPPFLECNRPFRSWCRRTHLPNTWGIASKTDAFKVITIEECIVPDADHAARNRHACQAGAMAERRVPETGDVSRNRHARQAVARGKR